MKYLSAAVARSCMRGLPFASLEDIAPGTSMVVAPHPDDESLGCGGMIAAASARGTPPVIVCVTDGSASHPGSTAYPPDRLRSVREDEMLAACAILGVDEQRVHFLRLTDAQAPGSGPLFEDAVDRIGALVRQYEVATIFSTWQHDPHCDHVASAAIAADAARAAEVRLRYYPVWGWLLPDLHSLPGPHPRGARLNVAAHMDTKRAAIAAHASQYSDMISDSPDGFRLPPDLLAVFDQPFEVYLES